MHLVEIFLPCERGDRTVVPEREFEDILKFLTDRFGGATAFTRVPAMGLWKGRHSVEEDRIIIIEVMVENLDMSWWRDYREQLRIQFQQEQLLVRATMCLTL